MMDLFAMLNEMVEKIETMRDDTMNFVEKENKAAGVRVRKQLQELIKCSQDARIFINDIIKSKKKDKD